MAENFDFGSFRQGAKSGLRKAILTATEHRRRIREGDFSVFRFPLAFAVAKDGLLDPLAHIPIVGVLVLVAFSFPVAVYLFIFMWGRGKWKIRAVAFVLSLFEIVPFASLIPWQTISVVYAYHLAKKEAEQSKSALEGLSRAVPKIRRQMEKIIGAPARVERRIV